MLEQKHHSMNMKKKKKINIELTLEFERIEIMIQRNLKKMLGLVFQRQKKNTKHIRRKATKKKQTNNLVL